MYIHHVELLHKNIVHCTVHGFAQRITPGIVLRNHMCTEMHIIIAALTRKLVCDFCDKLYGYEDELCGTNKMYYVYV